MVSNGLVVQVQIASELIGVPWPLYAFDEHRELGVRETTDTVTE